MSGGGSPTWTLRRPSAFEIATCFFPESFDRVAPGPKLRPCLISRVLRRRDTGLVACEVAFGTTNLKIATRVGLDLIVRDIDDLERIGLPSATRFDLDRAAVLPWDDRFFACWSGYRTPRIGALTEEYVKEYAYLMMRRFSR